MTQQHDFKGAQTDIKNCATNSVINLEKVHYKGIDNKTHEAILAALEIAAEQKTVDVVMKEVYTGKIKKGMKFIWMPFDSFAIDTLIVTKIEEIQGYENKIWSVCCTGEHWNYESSFREACIPVKRQIWGDVETYEPLLRKYNYYKKLTEQPDLRTR